MSEPQDHIWKLIENLQMAMLTTHSANDKQIRARPMAARVEPEENAIYFFTDVNAPKDHEIEKDDRVGVVFSDTKNMVYISVSGTADILNDRALVQRLWTPFDKAWFNDANDPNIRVIRVTPEAGEYWEGHGVVGRTVGMIAAAVQGKRPDLGKNEKVAM